MVLDRTWRRGEFCSVFATTIDGGSNIAIKMLRQNKLSSTSAARDLEFEMHLMSRIHHKHVLRCIGTSVPDAAPDRKFIALQTLQTTLHEALPPEGVGVRELLQRNTRCAGEHQEISTSTGTATTAGADIASHAGAAEHAATLTRPATTGSCP